MQKTFLLIFLFIQLSSIAQKPSVLGQYERITKIDLSKLSNRPEQVFVFGNLVINQDFETNQTTKEPIIYLTKTTVHNARINGQYFQASMMGDVSHNLTNQEIEDLQESESFIQKENMLYIQKNGWVSSFEINMNESEIMSEMEQNFDDFDIYNGDFDFEKYEIENQRKRDSILNLNLKQVISYVKSNLIDLAPQHEIEQKKEKAVVIHYPKLKQTKTINKYRINFFELFMHQIVAQTSTTMTYDISENQVKLNIETHLSDPLKSMLNTTKTMSLKKIYSANSLNPDQIYLKINFKELINTFSILLNKYKITNKNRIVNNWVLFNAFIDKKTLKKIVSNGVLINFHGFEEREIKARPHHNVPNQQIIKQVVPIFNLNFETKKASTIKKYLKSLIHNPENGIKQISEDQFILHKEGVFFGSPCTIILDKNNVCISNYPTANKKLISKKTQKTIRNKMKENDLIWAELGSKNIINFITRGNFSQEKTESAQDLKISSKIIGKDKLLIEVELSNEPEEFINMIGSQLR